MANYVNPDFDLISVGNDPVEASTTDPDDYSNVGNIGTDGDAD